MIRRYFFLLLAAILIFRSGYMYFEVDRRISGIDGKSPSIFYGRPKEIRKGDHLGNIRFTERLHRLSYKKVMGTPSSTGTFSEDGEHIRVFLRSQGNKKLYLENGPVDIVVRDSRIVSMVSSDGGRLEAIHLEPEEIGRIVGPKMESRHPVSLSSISPYLQNAVIASEDSRFYSHIGIDILAIGRALFVNLKEQRFAQGASTITQQLAKNFFLTPHKTIGRKLREAELSFILELRYSKKQILEMYLNKIYLGQDGLQGIYGIEEASIFYFSKQAKDISLEEAAMLAGIIHSPNRYSLFKNLKAAKERRNAVLSRMQRLAMIREDEFLRASNEPVRIRPARTPVHQTSYFVDYIQRITREEVGSEKFHQEGYHYYTTIDPVLQAAAEAAISKGLKEIEKTALPAGEPLQAALVAVDPRTGEVTAMVGGRDYGQTQFNRAVDTRRQSGSAFKPFVLLSALSLPLQGKGYKTLSSIVSGDSVSIPTPEGMWNPVNFENKVYGNITIRKTIEDSVNTAAVRLANDIGFPEVLKTARLAGISSPLLPVPSMILGSFEVTPIELAYAYTTIASGGIRFELFPLSSVTTTGGDIVIERTIRKKRVFAPQVAYLTGYAMQGVLERGTAKAAGKLGIYFPASGKTGTTNNNRDSWFVGYTSDVVCAVWVGYDSGTDTGLSGAGGALHIWVRFMRSLYPHSGPPSIIPPEGVETALIDPETGYLATASCSQILPEAYLSGTAPKEACLLHSGNPVADTIRNKIRSVGEFLRSLFQ